MRPIQKKKYPPLEAVYKKLREDIKNNVHTANDLYDELTRRAGILLPYALGEEQGWLCCYCMGKICPRSSKNGSPLTKEVNGKIYTETHHKVEHFLPRDIFNGQHNFSKSDNQIKLREDLRAEHSNLLLVCPDHAGAIQHCDSFKGDNEFVAMPNPAHVLEKDFDRIYQLQYNENGAISSNNSTINDELNTVVNLNHESLKAARKSAFKAISAAITRAVGEDWNKNYAKAIEAARTWRDMIDASIKKNTPLPYYTSTIYLLKKRFKDL